MLYAARVPARPGCWAHEPCTVSECGLDLTKLRWTPSLTLPSQGFGQATTHSLYAPISSCVKGGKSFFFPCKGRVRAEFRACLRLLPQ